MDSSKYNYRCPHRSIEDGFEIQSLLGLSHLVLLSILTNPITVGSFEPVKSHLASIFVLTFAELTRGPKYFGMFFVDNFYKFITQLKDTNQYRLLCCHLLRKFPDSL